MRPRFSVDRCELKDGVFLLQGWLIGPDRSAACRVELVGSLPDGSDWRLDIPLQHVRPDVVERFPDWAGLPNGFFHFGKLPPVSLKAVIGHCPSCAPVVLMDLAPQRAPAPMARRLRLAGALVAQALSYARAGQWRLLFEKASRRLESARAPRVALDADLLARLAAARIDALVIDHDLGGGANQFRRQWVDQQTREGRRVALIVYSVLRLGYVLSLHDRTGEQKVGVFEIGQAQALLASIAPKTILYNNAVSHPDAARWPDLVAGLLEAPGSQGEPGAARPTLSVAVHDFFPICPSQHLLDRDDRFCGVPREIERCEACLAGSRQPFIELYREIGMHGWRARWGRLLQAADQIVAFSPSSQALLRRAYPDLNPGRLVLRPHELEPLSDADQMRIERWRQTRPRSAVIAVMGSITSTAKGARVLSRLSGWIVEQGLPWRLHLIGSALPPVAAPGVYTETGPYRREDLVGHVLACNPALFFFPSVAPETFSFVLRELARFGLPIAGFGIGAQGDFLARYEKAIRLPDSAMDNPALLGESLRPFLAHGLTPVGDPT